MTREVFIAIVAEEGLSKWFAEVLLEDISSKVLEGLDAGAVRWAAKQTFEESKRLGVDITTEK